LSRPTIYNSYHEIEAVNKSGSLEKYDIRGNTVLQSDFLGKNRLLPKIEEGDILVIKNVGAYGKAMSSGFPGKPLPKEVMIYSNNEIKEI